jgi:hypothetical protein
MTFQKHVHALAFAMPQPYYSYVDFFNLSLNIVVNPRLES